MLKNQPNQAANNSNSLFANDSRKELIPIIQKQGEQLIDARQLHEFLEIKTKFTQWFQIRVKEYDFKNGLDYFPNFGNTGFKPTNEFKITLDMAKELAMLERSDKGRQIRQYFIACEKKLREVAKIDVPLVTKMLKEIDKSIKPIRINNRKVYEYRKVQDWLGFSTKSSIGHVRKSYESQLVIFDKKAYISERYVEVMISRANTRNLEVVAKASPAVLQISFSNPLNFSNP